MRPVKVVPAVLGLVCALAFVGVAVPRLAAQDTTQSGDTPAVTRNELTPGLFAEVFAGAPSDRAPQQTVYIARFTFEPGSEIYPHGHPGTVVLAVESGSFGWTLVEGTAHVVRGAGSGGTEVEDVTEAGIEVILEPGDAIYYEADVIHTARDAGEEPAIVLATLVLQAGEPLLMAADEMAGMEMGETPES
jgi:quercetin dioxygenase-like cupin family protein